MRRLVKRLLKKYNYPPEKTADALETVLRQCEQWADNEDYYISEHIAPAPKPYQTNGNYSIAAEPNE